MSERPSPTSTHRSPLSVIAAISGLYDLLAGAALLLGRRQIETLFHLAPPVPLIHYNLNALFLLAVGVGYWLPYREPERYRGYLWVMGPLLKGAGATVFIVDHLTQPSPTSFLIWAATDGILAIATLWVLLSTRRPQN